MKKQKNDIIKLKILSYSENEGIHFSYSLNECVSHYSIHYSTKLAETILARLSDDIIDSFISSKRPLYTILLDGAELVYDFKYIEYMQDLIGEFEKLMKYVSEDIIYSAE